MNGSGSIVKTVLFSAFIALSGCSNTKDVKDQAKREQEALYEVTIHVTQTSSYCGGAPPSDQMLEDLRTPGPLPNKKIYIRRGKFKDIDRPVIQELSSNQNGVVQTQLPAGEYSIVFSDKKDRSIFNELVEKYGDRTEQYEAINEECLKKHFKRPALTFTIGTKTASEIEVNDHKKCPRNSVPCAGYTGSVPPAAPPQK